MNKFSTNNKEVISNYKKSLRKLNKRIKEVTDSISFFSTHTFEDVPASYVSDLQGELNKLNTQANQYKSLITGLNKL